MLSSDALDIFNSLSLGFLFCFVVVVASPAGFSPWQVPDWFVPSPDGFSPWQILDRFVSSPDGFSPWQILDRFVSSPDVPDVFRFNKSRTGLRLHLMVFHRG